MMLFNSTIQTQQDRIAAAYRALRDTRTIWPSPQLRDSIDHQLKNEIRQAWDILAKPIWC